MICGLPGGPGRRGDRSDMDDLSNRDLSQVPDEELTPAERQELKRRLDAFIAVMRDKVFTRDSGMNYTDVTGTPRSTVTLSPLF